MSELKETKNRKRYVLGLHAVACSSLSEEGGNLHVTALTVAIVPLTAIPFH